MTTDWPKASASFWPTVRAVMSAAPPAALGTTILMVFEGNAGVWARLLKQLAKAKIKTARGCMNCVKLENSPSEFVMKK
jgi:hypothetical protein